MTGETYPETVAYWDIDETTGEVRDVGSYTNWD